MVQPDQLHPECPHGHRILLAIANVIPGTDSQLLSLPHGSGIVVTPSIALDEVAHLKDCHALASFDLPLPSALSPTQTIAHCLQRLATALDHDVPPPGSPIEDRARLAIDHLKYSSTELNTVVNIHLYSLTVFTDQEDQNQPFGTVSESHHPEWKWIKPTSPYRQHGSWSTSLPQVIHDGSWAAGKNLTLLARTTSSPPAYEHEDAVKFSSLFSGV